MALRAGTLHRVIERAGKFKRWAGTGSSSLWLNHNRDGGNDRQIAAMVDAWGLPEVDAVAMPLQSA
jgi:hypothetical protein